MEIEKHGATIASHAYLYYPAACRFTFFSFVLKSLFGKCVFFFPSSILLNVGSPEQAQTRFKLNNRGTSEPLKAWLGQVPEAKVCFDVHGLNSFCPRLPCLTYITCVWKLLPIFFLKKKKKDIFANSCSSQFQSGWKSTAIMPSPVMISHCCFRSRLCSSHFVVLIQLKFQLCFSVVCWFFVVCFVLSFCFSASTCKENDLNFSGMVAKTILFLCFIS